MAKADDFLVLALNGDGDAYEVCHDVFCSIAYSILHDQQLAEDVAHDTFKVSLAVLRGLRAPGTRLSTRWAFRVARNRALDIRGSAGRRREFQAEEQLSDVEARRTIVKAGDVNLEDLDPKEELPIALSTVLRLRMLLDKDDHAEKILVLLLHEAGFPYRLIALALGITEETARQWVRRLREHLDRWLTEGGEEK